MLHSQNASRTPLVDGRAGPVGAVEGRAQVLAELGAIARDVGSDGVEGLNRSANALVLVLSISGGMAPSSNTLATRVGAVAVEVAGHLAAAGGVTDQDHILEVEGVEELREVVGLGVQVVAIPGLAGAAAAGAVVGANAPTGAWETARMPSPALLISLPPAARPAGRPPLVMAVEQLLPPPVAGGSFGGPDDVGEQHRGQQPLRSLAA